MQRNKLFTLLPSTRWPLEVFSPADLPYKEHGWLVLIALGQIGHLGKLVYENGKISLFSSPGKITGHGNQAAQHAY